MNMIKLYGHPDSGHAYKVKLMLTVSGLAHDYQVIDIKLPHAERPEPFRTLARYGEVPLLTIDDIPYVQSDAILCVLAELTGKFGAESLARMARTREWLFWEANRLGLSLPNLRFGRKFAPAQYPPGSLDWLQLRYDNDIAILNQVLSNRHAFILDDQPTIADFSLCGYLFHAAEANVIVPAAVQTWLKRISQLPGWQPPYEALA